MAERKPQWPVTGDLATYGAYADEPNKRGILHASNISSYTNHQAGFGSSFRREN